MSIRSLADGVKALLKGSRLAASEVGSLSYPEKNIRHARRLYEEYQAHAYPLGAFAVVSSRDEKKFQFDSQFARVNAECVVVTRRSICGNSSNVLVLAPSPWHAAIHLIGRGRGWLLGRNPYGSEMPLLYRGQADAEWDMIPSLYRSSVNITEERESLAVFINLLRRFYLHQIITCVEKGAWLSFLSDDSVPDLVHAATAQHYGLRTSLLDFTVDPAVAVWFACRQTHEASSRPAAVFAIPLELAASRGASILLPHLYIRRLYRQRGVFVNVPESMNAGNLRRVSIEVRFPADPAFQVLRGGKSICLMGFDDPHFSDAWWMHRVGTARHLASEGQLATLLTLPMTNDGYLAVADMTDEWDYLPPWLILENRQRIVHQSLDDLLQLLLSLTTVVDLRGARVSRSAVQLIVAHSDTIRTMLSLLRQKIDALPEDALLRQVSEAMLDALEALVPSMFRHRR
jgi:hypothetical protein